MKLLSILAFLVPSTTTTLKVTLFVSGPTDPREIEYALVSCWRITKTVDYCTIKSKDKTEVVCIDSRKPYPVNCNRYIK